MAAQCSVDGCEKTVNAKRLGLCGMHQHRLQTRGTLDDPLPRTRSICTMDGCSRIVNSGGLCNMHITRLRKTGSLELLPETRRWVRSSTPAIDRFYRFTQTSGECLIWTGRINQHGNPHFAENAKVGKSARKWLYEHTTQTVVSGEIWPTCDNRLCVAFEHAEVLTGAEGNRRRADRITHCPQGHPYAPENTYYCRGERICKRCSLNRRQVRRSVYDAGDDIDTVTVGAIGGWFCALCGEPVDPSHRGTEPSSRSIDHILPLARGRAAHLDEHATRPFWLQ